MKYFKMDVDFLEDGSAIFTVARNGIFMRFQIAQPFKYGVDKWRFIRNSGVGDIRYDGYKMSNTHSNMTLLFYEGMSGTYQWVRFADGILELGIELERGSKTRYSKSSISIPLEEALQAIDKMIEWFEKV
jgi:hypothetical protein